MTLENKRNRELVTSFCKRLGDGEIISSYIDKCAIDVNAKKILKMKHIDHRTGVKIAEKIGYSPEQVSRKYTDALKVFAALA